MRILSGGSVSRALSLGCPGSTALRAGRRGPSVIVPFVATGEVPVPLADAVIFLMAFVELSGEDVIDPDQAVTALENACYDLSRLSRDERQALCARAAQLASETSEHRTALREFLRDFGDACGLLDDE